MIWDLFETLIWELLDTLIWELFDFYMGLVWFDLDLLNTLICDLIETLIWHFLIFWFVICLVLWFGICLILWFGIGLIFGLVFIWYFGVWLVWYFDWRKRFTNNRICFLHLIAEMHLSGDAFLQVPSLLYTNKRDQQWNPIFISTLFITMTETIQGSFKVHFPCWGARKFIISVSIWNPKLQNSKHLNAFDNEEMWEISGCVKRYKSRPYS